MKKRKKLHKGKSQENRKNLKSGKNLKKEKHLKKGLLILVIVLAVLGLGVWAVTAMNSEEELPQTNAQMVQKDPIPNLAQVINLKAELTDDSLELVYLEENDLTYSAQYKWFLVSEDGYVVTSQSVVKGLILFLQELSWLSCEASDVTDLSTYGLAEPAAKYEITYLEEGEEKIFTLHIGDTAARGVYAMIPGTGNVYTIHSNVGQLLKNLNTASYACNDVVLVDLEIAHTIQLEMDDQVYSLTKTEVTKTDAETGEDVQVAVWMLQEKIVDIAATLETMSELTGTPVDLDVSQLSPELTVTFERDHEKFPTVQVVFYRHTGTESVAVLNEGTPMLVTRTEITALKEALLTLLLGS